MDPLDGVWNKIFRSIYKELAQTFPIGSMFNPASEQLQQSLITNIF